MVEVCAAANVTCFYDAITVLQGSPEYLFAEDPRHCRIIDTHFPAIKDTISELMGCEFPPSFRLTTDAEFEQALPMAMQAEENWFQQFPADFAVYQQMVRRVVYAWRDEYSGGSVSSRIGWIWMSPQQGWDVSDYLENLIHEYVHNALFLEEMVHTLFSTSGANMAAPENRIVSAIRRVPRYFDQAFHAAGVALVLLEVAENNGRFDTSRSILDGLLPSLDALKDRLDLLSPNGVRVLNEMIDRALKAYDNISHMSAVA